MASNLSANSSNAVPQNASQNLISQALRSHLSSSGLLGQCSDIRLKTFGKVYSLHRLLLIQSGFFNSMLLSGFKEGLDLDDAAVKRNRSKSNRRARSQALMESHDEDSVDDDDDDDDDDVIELHFDDPQITRPAFEFAIAHLYGAAPTLILPVWASPSAEQPLSPVFGVASSSSTANEQTASTSDSFDEESVTERHSTDQQPATPRFLCSLIATSIYLGLPALTSQALTLILCSITPYTVTQYLHFAIGRGISGASEARARHLAGVRDDAGILDWELEGPIRGLQLFAKKDSSALRNVVPAYTSDGSEEEAEAEEEEDVSSGSNHGRTSSFDPAAASQLADAMAENSSRKRGRGQANFSSSSPSKPSPKTASKKNRYREPSYSGPPHLAQSSRAVYLYGSTGEKIGEACACWLSRWGTEVFEVEELEVTDQSAFHQEQKLYHAEQQPAFASVMGTPPPIRVWSKGSLPSSWVKALISGDSFFVPDEWERYRFATRVVNLRRSQSRLTDADRALHQQRANVDDFYSNESEGEDHSLVGRKINGDQKDASFNSSKKSAGTSSRKQKGGVSIKINDGSIISRRSQAKIDAKEGRVEEGSASESDSEEEYSQLFSEGIYYTHMEFNRLEQILAAGDASLEVLQSALWRNQTLRTLIENSEQRVTKSLQRSSSPTVRGVFASNVSPETIEPTEAEVQASSLAQNLSLLDFVKSQELSCRSRNSSPFPGSRSTTPLPSLANLSLGPSSTSKPIIDLSRRYYPVPIDDTIRLGEGLASLANPLMIYSEQQSRESNATGVAAWSDPNTLPLPPLCKTHTHESPAVGGPLIEISAKGFFGLDNWVRTGHAIASRGAKVAEQPLEDFMDETASSVQDEAEMEKQSSDETTDFNGREKDAAEEQEDEEEQDTDEEEATPETVAEDLDGIVGEAEEEQAAQGQSTSPSHPIPLEKKGVDSSPLTNSPDPVSSLLTQEHWSGFEPMRVSFEFFGVDKLQEKQRLYSPTFHFAGSLWNVYVQTLKKPKGLQLGVYLHRQNPADALPAYSAPFPPPSPSATDDAGPRKTATVVASSSWVTPRAGSSVSHPADSSVTSALPSRENPMNAPNHQSGTTSANDQIGCRYYGSRRPSTYSLLSPPSTSMTNSQPYTNSAEMPSMPYKDGRKMLRASFSIHCPSPLGTALTRFSSAPDQFTLSQSWGWKSSSLLGSTYLADGVLGSAKTEASGRFRCCCVIGLV